MEGEEDERHLLIIYLFFMTFGNSFKNKCILNEKLIAENCEIALENSF